MLKPKKMRRQITLSNRQRRRVSPLALVGVGVTMLVIVCASAILIIPRVFSHADTVNMDCTLVVPSNPLSARGLATPYQLSATNAANGACNEANANQSAFVQGVIYNPATGAFSVYSPLIIDATTQPAVVPTVPKLPQNAVVALWFGFNGNNLTLKGAQGNTLRNANCTNGSNGSVFGQFAYCNATPFFHAANRGHAQGKFQIPALQVGNDGLPCPTVRDFSIIDQDQSDNVQTQYLALANGQIAQNTAANLAKLATPTLIGNPSDNFLVTGILDPLLGCTPWTAPNLADNNNPVSALPLDELMAAADQQAPVALVPINDPMTLNNGNASLTKTNLYRRGVDQSQANNQNAANGATYCRLMIQASMPRLQKDQTLFANATSPAPAVGNSLFTFLANRLQQSYVNLNCQNLLNLPNPVTLQTDGNGVVIGATFGAAASSTPAATPTVATSATPGATPATTPTAAPSGQQGANGSATLTFSAHTRTITLTPTFTYAARANHSVIEAILVGSCTGNVFFNQRIDLGDGGVSSGSVTINNVQAIAANWFYAVLKVPTVNRSTLAADPYRSMAQTRPQPSRPPSKPGTDLLPS